MIVFRDAQGMVITFVRKASFTGLRRQIWRDPWAAFKGDNAALFLDPAGDYTEFSFIIIFYMIHV